MHILIRYCQQCDGIRHNARRGDNHVLQKPLTSPWTMSSADREVLQSAVISLLSLARPFGSEQTEEIHRRTMNLLDDEDDDDEEFSFDDYLMASRYGVWLLVALFHPKPEDNARQVQIHIEINHFVMVSILLLSNPSIYFKNSSLFFRNMHLLKCKAISEKRNK